MLLTTVANNNSVRASSVMQIAILSGRYISLMSSSSEKYNSVIESSWPIMVEGL